MSKKGVVKLGRVWKTLGPMLYHTTKRWLDSTIVERLLKNKSGASTIEILTWVDKYRPSLRGKMEKLFLLM